MQTKFFCDLYVSEGWEEKKLKLIKKSVSYTHLTLPTIA